MKLSADILIPLLVSFFISLILGHFVIPFLTKMKIGQTEREEGVESHLKKAGTPTMGGVIFLAAVAITCLFFVRRYPRIVPVLCLMIGFGLIGFLDDFLKVVKHRSDGLYPRQKMALQFVVTALFVIYLLVNDRVCLDMLLPFSGGRVVSGDAMGGFFRILAVIVAFFAIIGTANAVNFTDGLDGLASSVTAVVAVFFLLASLTISGRIEPITAAVTGALLGFLVYNVYPAKVFMGDTGSLALGGFVAGCAYMLQMPLFILLVGLIYLAEILSVVLQVAYFRNTGGKRLFKMTPIHHHFELCGWSEPRIVAVFSIVTILLCAIALYGIC